VIVVALVAGCATVEDTVYLRGIDARSTLASHPVAVTDSLSAGRIQLSFRASRSPVENITGQIPVSGPVPPDSVDSTNRDRNLLWSFPPTQIGFDLVVPLSRVFGLEGGIQLSPASDRTFVGGYVGCALSGKGDGLGIRLSGGIRWSTVQVTAYSTVVTRTQSWFSSPKEEIWFFRDSVNITPMDWYGTLTLNTNIHASPLNVFVQGAMLRQGLARYTPSSQIYPLVFVTYTQTDTRTDYTVTLWSLTPGLSLQIGDQMRVLAGARWLSHDIMSGSPSSIWIPFFQVDLLLGI